MSGLKNKCAQKVCLATFRASPVYGRSANLFGLRRNKLRLGFSLIEVLVAMSILVIGLFAIFKAFPLGLKSINRDSASINSMLLAQEKIEELLSLDYAELMPGLIEPRHDLGGDFAGFERESRITLLDSDLKPIITDNKLKLIEVTVWTLGTPGSGSTTLKTIVSKK